MYTPPSEHGLRPPSPTAPKYHQRQISLSIRTGVQKTQHTTHNGTFASPTEHIHPEFPLPIPSEKQEKARKLYRKYLMEYKLEQRKHEPHSATSYLAPYLDVPGRRSSSISSRSSSRRRRTASITTATNDAATDFASVVSFDGDEALSTKVKGELKSFNGSSVKPARVRKQFTPVQKAKTALIRWLKSCERCQPRKVPCQLTHYDLDSLLRTGQASNSQTQSQNKALVSPTTSSQHTSTGLDGSETSGFSQSNELAGIGYKYSLVDHEPIAATLDIQSPASCGYTQEPDFESAGFVAPASIPEASTSLNHTYQNGGMFPLAVFEFLYYVCQHLNGNAICGQMCADEEELQHHFSIVHFDFVRLYPAHRYVCSQCKYLNNDSRGPCYNCRAQQSIQVWLYGNHIQISNFSRYAPDGQNMQQFNNYATFVPSPMPNITWTMNLNPFGGNTNPGQFNMQNGNLYGGPGSQSYDLNSSSEAGPDGSQYLGSNYDGARQFAIGIPQLARLGFVKSRQLVTRCRINMLLFSLMAILVLGYSFQWIMCKAEAHYQSLSYRFQAQLPIVGFMVFLASFAVSLLAKYFWNKRLRRRGQSTMPTALPSEYFSNIQMQVVWA